METYLFAWNPSRWKWNDLGEMSEKVKQGQHVIKDWSITNRHAKIGDRAFLIKLGKEPKGIFASGTIVREPYLKEHWNPIKAKNGEKIFFVDIRFDVLLNPRIDLILRRDQFDSRSLTKYYYETQNSGVLIPDNIAETLEKTWGNFTRKIPRETLERIGLEHQEQEEKIPINRKFNKNGKPILFDHWKTFLTILVSGIGIAMLIMFFIYQARGIKTEKPAINLEITTTPTVVLIPTSTSTAKIVSTTTPISTPTPTSPPTPTSTPTLIFSDPFLVDNPINWRLPDKTYWGTSVEASIGSKKLQVIIKCPSSDQYLYCVPYVTLLQPLLKDYDLSFDLIIEQQSANANIGIDFRFRENPGNIFYAFHLNSLGEYFFYLDNPAQIPLISQPKYMPDNPTIGKPISIRIIANNSVFSIYENGQPLVNMKDDRLNLPGTFSAYYYISQGGTATISLQNFRISAIP